MKADLHLHSLFSDGKFSPFDLAEICKSKKIGVVSLCDHDSVKGSIMFAEKARDLGLECIDGVELSAFFNGREVHILGYFINPADAPFRKRLKSFQDARKKRVILMVKKLNGLGLKMKLKDVKKHVKKGLFGRMHVALALRDLEHVKNTDEAFRRYVGYGKSGYVAKDYFSPSEAASLIVGAGGIPVIAHPGSARITRAEIDELAKTGIRGIEVIHPKHSKGQERFYRGICDLTGLCPTGGSDFHGHGRTEFDNLGKKCVTLHEIEKLKKASLGVWR